MNVDSPVIFALSCGTAFHIFKIDERTGGCCLCVFVVALFVVVDTVAVQVVTVAVGVYGAAVVCC